MHQFLKFIFGIKFYITQLLYQLLHIYKIYNIDTLKH